MTSQADEQAETIVGPWDSFDAHVPRVPETPVVVSVPHAGIETGPFASALSQSLDLRLDADLHVDALYGGAPRGAFVRARLSRFVCDLNRHPDDVSPRAVPQHPAPRNENGRGFVWEITTAEDAALARPLTLGEWEERRQIHEAYHQCLSTALARARARFGFAILVDGHSMPSRGRAGHTDNGAARAEIVPGNRQGQSCGEPLSRAVGQHFAAAGYQVSFNDPYQGGFVTRHHGQPTHGVHAIQIEVRRDLYMDEATFARTPEGFARLSATLHALLRRLDGLDPRAA